MADAAPVLVGSSLPPLVRSACPVRQIQQILIVRDRVIVVIHPLRMPKRSWMTLASGARQFVVHDAFEMMLVLRRVVAVVVDAQHERDIGALGGAVTMTFFAPASMCFAAPSRAVKMPVDSNTTCTPRSFHGSCAGSFTEDLELFSVDRDAIVVAFTAASKIRAGHASAGARASWRW